MYLAGLTNVPARMQAHRDRQLAKRCLWSMMQLYIQKMRWWIRPDRRHDDSFSWSHISIQYLCTAVHFEIMSLRVTPSQAAPLFGNSFFARLLNLIMLSFTTLSRVMLSIVVALDLDLEHRRRSGRHELSS